MQLGINLRRKPIEAVRISVSMSQCLTWNSYDFIARAAMSWCLLTTFSETKCEKSRIFWTDNIAGHGVKLGRRSVARFHKVGALRPSIHFVVSVPLGVLVVKLFVSRGAVNLSVIKLKSVYTQGRLIRRMSVDPCVWAVSRFAPRQVHNTLKVSRA